MWRKGNPCALLVGMQTGAAAVENSMEFPQKIKTGTAYDSVISLLGIYLKKPETLTRKTYVPLCSLPCYLQYPRFGSSPSAHQQMSVKKAVVHLHNGILLAIKKKEILSFMTAWMELESIILSKISQSEKDKYHMISLMCGI